MQFSWRLRFLGAPCLVGGAGDARVLSLSPKDAALLTYVGLNESARSAAVAGLLWPQSDERGAMNNLRQRLHRLRRDTCARLLEVTGTARLAADLVLEARPTLSALAADPGAWDDELLSTCRCDDAIEFGAWLLLQRRAWAAARVEALAGIASDAEREGQLARALTYARHLLAHEPFSEHVHRRLMRLHYLRGDTAAAVSAFEACERALKDELGLRPSAETIDLLRTIERGTPVARAAAEPMPASLLRPPQTVGRDDERARLSQAHADGQCVVVVGEAGMGKTRLLQEFVATRPRAIYTQARPGDVSVPYGALARLLKALAPAFGDAGAAIASGSPPAIERLFVLALESGELTLVVDDLHFADRASIEMLQTLVDAERLAALHWVFAHRPLAVADADAALLGALADAPRVCWIVLAPLSEGALVELLEQLVLPTPEPTAFARALVKHTGGNPLYVLETLRAARAGQAGAPAKSAGLVLPRPAGIAHLIDRRLLRLSDDALSLGRVAALAGPDFSTDLAEHALATPALRLASAWAELEAADVLRGHEFAHDLVRDGMLRATPQVIAVHAHRLIAQFLGARSIEPARLAPHWLAAGEPGRAAIAFREAAQSAFAAGRPREQAELLAQCAHAFGQAGDAEAAMRAGLDALGPMLQSEGVDAALAHIDRLLAQPAVPALVAHAWSARAMALMWGGRLADAEQAAQHALALAAPADDAVRVNAVCMLAAVRGQRGDPQAAVALLQPWLSRIDAIDDDETRIAFFGNLSAMLMQADRSAEALPAAQRHLALARALGNPGEQVTALMNLSNLHGRRGDLGQAIAAGEEAAGLISETAQSTSLLAWNRITLGYWLAGAGRFAEGLANFGAALDEFGRPGGNPMLLSMAQDLCARVWLTLGQVARAHRLVDSPAGGAGRVRARQLYTRAKVRLAMGQGDDELLREAQSLVGEADPVGIAAGIDLTMRGPEPPMAARLEALQRIAQDHEYFPLAALAASRRVTALVRAGRRTEAAVLLPEAERAALLSRGPHVYLPELLETCATAYAALGDTGSAQRCIEVALHWLRAEALPNVPPEFVDGFLQRNPVNLRLRSDPAIRPRLD